MCSIALSLHTGQRYSPPLSLPCTCIWYSSCTKKGIKLKQHTRERHKRQLKKKNKAAGQVKTSQDTAIFFLCVRCTILTRRALKQTINTCYSSSTEYTNEGNRINPERCRRPPRSPQQPRATTTYPSHPCTLGVDPELARRAADGLHRVVFRVVRHSARGAVVAVLVLVPAGQTQPHLKPK